MSTLADRSMERIEISDLHHLADIAADVEADLFARHPASSGRYAGRLLCRVLCQGAALHYVDHTNGVKDFDVWSFYTERADGPFPARWRGTADFGRSKFGRFPGDPARYQGRRVDLMGRSLHVPLTADSADVLRSYLSAARTESARALAAKAAVLIVPSDRVGEIIWPDPRRPHPAPERHATCGMSLSVNSIPGDRARRRLVRYRSAAGSRCRLVAPERVIWGRLPTHSHAESSASPAMYRNAEQRMSLHGSSARALCSSARLQEVISATRSPNIYVSIASSALEPGPLIRQFGAGWRHGVTGA